MISDTLEIEYRDAHVASQYAWWILEAISGKNQAILIAHDIAPFSQKDFDTIYNWLEKITQEHMPLQYVIGSVPFDGIEIIVKPPVLIPRPETEEWCSILIAQLRTLQSKRISILDLAAGSGCIGLTLAHCLKESIVHGTDISQEALSLAERNKNFNGITNAHFFYSDLFSHVTDTYDLIVSNPPYIAPSEWELLDKNVKDWEDKRALVAENEGVEIIASIIEFAPGYLKKNTEFTQQRIANVWIEIGYMQGEAVLEIMKKHAYTDVKVHKDLCRKDRYVTGIAPIREN